MYPLVQKFMSFAGLFALLFNMGNVVKKGDLETLNIATLSIFLIQQFVAFIVHYNYTSTINPTVWRSGCMVSIVASNVILFLMYLKVNGYGTCHKVRECTESNDATGPNLIKLPSWNKEMKHLAGALVFQITAFSLMF